MSEHELVRKAEELFQKTEKIYSLLRKGRSLLKKDRQPDLAVTTFEKSIELMSEVSSS